MNSRRPFGLMRCVMHSKALHPDDLRVVIDAIVARGAPAQAHTLFERARSLWRWAIGSGAYGLTAAPTGPLRAKSLIGSKVSRSRVLSHAEIKSLGSLEVYNQAELGGLHHR
jgi:hypothetical protein